MHNRLLWASAFALALLTGCAPTLVQSGEERFSSNDAALLHPCPRNTKSTKVPCRLSTLPQLATLEKIADASYTLSSGNTLTFAVRDPSAAFVRIVGGISTYATHVFDSDIWAVSVYVPELPKARIGFQFVTDSTRGYAAEHEFRGSDAESTLQSAALHGVIREVDLYSYSLTATRRLVVYTPPVASVKPYKVIYAADGALVRSLAPAIDTLIAAGTMEPVVIVGVRAAESTDDRTREYVYGFDADSSAFLAHEKFFVDEVSAWAEANLHVDSARAGKTIWGASNGGAFAIAMGLRHPDQFSRVIAMSPVYADIPMPKESAALPQFFLAAGSFEETTNQRAGLLVSALRDMHAPTKFEEFVGGHDAVVWVDTSVRDFVSLQ